MTKKTGSGECDVCSVSLSGRLSDCPFCQPEKFGKKETTLTEVAKAIVAKHVFHNQGLNDAYMVHNEGQDLTTAITEALRQVERETWKAAYDMANATANLYLEQQRTGPTSTITMGKGLGALSVRNEIADKLAPGKNEDSGQ